MSIPSDPTVAQLITDGMIEGGQYTVTNGSAAQTTFQNSQFQTIKTEIWSVCKTDKLLETQACLVAAAYTSLISWPTDFDSEIRLILFDADSTFRGTAQAGGTATITLASTFSATPTDIEGRFIFITGGTGSGQYAQILSYNDTTKVVTVTANWGTQPDNTSVYLVQQYQVTLNRSDYEKATSPNARPRWYSRVGTSLYVYPAPDQAYPILLEYRSNLTRLDEAGSLFVKHIRERRSLWINGIRYYTGSRYDDDRAPGWKELWDQALLRYAAENAVYEQSESYR